jgi:hypothetical protein
MGNALAQNEPKLNLSVSASFNMKEFEGEICGQRNFLIRVHFKAICGNDGLKSPTTNKSQN